jgi:monofunctional biosynthetic peptidoglycan transglycosylase
MANVNGLRRAMLRTREAAEDLYTAVRADWAPLDSLDLFAFTPPADSPRRARAAPAAPPAAAPSAPGLVPAASALSAAAAEDDEFAFDASAARDAAAEALLRRFQVSTDAVLGGGSRAELTARRYRSFRAGVFSGELDFHDPSAEAMARGGFAAFRTKADERVRDLSAFEGLALRVKTDGRAYTANVKCADHPPDALWQMRVVTRPFEWVSVGLPFRDMVLSRRGRVEPEQLPVSRAQVSGLGVLLADGRNGPFRFEIQWARAVRSFDGFVSVPEQLIAGEPRPEVEAADAAERARQRALMRERAKAFFSLGKKADALPSGATPVEAAPPSAAPAGSAGDRDRERQRAALLREHRDRLAEATLEKPLR